jgi:rare lipoprotein A (peptidoglycan hydrolase)
LLKKILLSVILCTSLTACLEGPVKKRGHHHIMGSAHNAQIRENSLDYAKLADGEVMYDEPASPKNKGKLNVDYSEVGVASWYGGKFHGRRTANGAVYNQHHYTAAHRTMMLPSVARVTNLSNNRSVLVIVNDRGPYVKTSKRIIDVSKQAAKDLGMINAGTAKVRVDYMHDETIKLLQKYPAKEQAKANTLLNQHLQRHMVELNAKHGNT